MARDESNGMSYLTAMILLALCAFLAMWAAATGRLERKIPAPRPSAMPSLPTGGNNAR